MLEGVNTVKVEQSELIRNITKAYFHNPYILRLSCVDLIQFVERFTRFNLYPEIKLVGFLEQRNWERIVRNYLEEFHSFIEFQRNIQASFSRSTGEDVDAIRTIIVNPLPVDSRIIQELRRRVHHEEGDDVIKIIEAFSPRFGHIPAIPLILISQDWFSDGELKARALSILDDPKSLWNTFAHHCDHFIQSSNNIGNEFFRILGHKTIPPS